VNSRLCTENYTVQLLVPYSLRSNKCGTLKTITLLSDVPTKKTKSVTFYSHSVYIIFYVSLNRLINWLTNWLVLIGKHLLVCILLPNAYICRSRVFVAKRYLYKAVGWNVDWNENCFGSSLMLMDPRAVQMSQKRFQIFPFALTFLYQKICKNYPWDRVVTFLKNLKILQLAGLE